MCIKKTLLGDKMKPKLRMEQIFSRHCITDSKESRKIKKRVRRQVKRSDKNKFRRFIKRYFL